MKILVVKMSSLGDVLHTLPAVTDAAASHPGVQIDWVVEESFARVPGWHPKVDRVIQTAFRRWRNRPFASLGGGEFWRCIAGVRERQYDCVIDAQGLLKSAVITRLARGAGSGYDRPSAREPLAALGYRHRFAVARDQHAVTRLRQLFARSLDYSLPDTLPDYGIRRRFSGTDKVRGDYIVFLHGTTWPSKQWPCTCWRKLAELVATAGFTIKLPWGTEEERRQANDIAADFHFVEVLPRLGLDDLAYVLGSARGVVGVDTGLSHLAAALEVPVVTLYGATDPLLTGTTGRHQANLRAEFPCSPCLRRVCSYRDSDAIHPACYRSLPAREVWICLQSLMQAGHVAEKACVQA